MTSVCNGAGETVVLAARIKHIVPLIILLLGLVCCGRAARPRVQHSELAMRIASVLPGNWGMEESNGQILLTRREPIRTHGCIGLDLSWARHPELLREDVEKNGLTQEYKIRLRLASKVSLEEYARLKESNSQIRVTKSTVIESREFYEDSAMKSFDSRYRELPEYYDKDSSIYVQTTLYPWECIYPGDVARECEKVRQALDTALTRYPEAERRSTLSWMGQ